MMINAEYSAAIG